MTMIGPMGMSPTQMATKMQEKFETADIDESGTVSREEFMANSSEDRDSATIDKMFERLDTDGDGQITQEEQQAMADQMAERANKMAEMKASGGNVQEMFSSLLETLSADDDNNSEQSDFITNMKEQLASGSMDQQDLAQSIMEVTKKFPRINTTA